MARKKIKNAQIDCLLRNFRIVLENGSADCSYDEQLTKQILARASILQKFQQQPEAALERILTGIARESQQVAELSELEKLQPERLLVTRADLLRVSNQQEIDEDSYSISDAIYEVAISWIRYSIPSTGVVAYAGWFVGFVPKISLVNLLQNGLIL